MIFSGKFGVCSRRRASADFVGNLKAPATCLGLASHYVAGTDLHEYRARIADQRGDIHCTNRELDKAEGNYKLAQETADASGQLWLQAQRWQFDRSTTPAARTARQDQTNSCVVRTNLEANKELRKIPLSPGTDRSGSGKLWQCRARLSQRARKPEEVWLAEHRGIDTGSAGAAAHEARSQRGSVRRVGPSSQAFRNCPSRPPL